MDKSIEMARAFTECWERGRKKLRTCFHPGCSDRAINSHILQKNGILSNLAQDNHVMEIVTNFYGELPMRFKKNGINQAFSFDCFCRKHDSLLFSEIENSDIDFENYRHMLLLSLRSLYNEIYRKQSLIYSNEILIKEFSHLLSPRDLDKFKEGTSGYIDGVQDLHNMASTIWQDLNNATESYIFKFRTTNTIDICLSSFFTYESTRELWSYAKFHGRQKPEVCDLFVNIFPYKQQTYFTLGWPKKYDNMVCNWTNDFFLCSDKRLKTKITNLLLFSCETWATSIDMYKNRIQGRDDIFMDAASFHSKNLDERRFFDINLFSSDFIAQYYAFRKENPLGMILLRDWQY